MGGGNFVVILTSPDLTSWSTQPDTNINYLEGIAYGNGLFVATGAGYDPISLQSSDIVMSPDGTNWTMQNLGTSDFELSSVI